VNAYATRDQTQIIVDIALDLIQDLVEDKPPTSIICYNFM